MARTAATIASLLTLLFAWGSGATFQTSNGTEPKGLRLTLLLDTSNSMKDMLQNVRATGAAIVENLGGNDFAQVMTFAGKVEVVQKFTSNRAELTQAILAIPKSSGTSSLYNAIYVALKNGAHDPEDTRPHVIVVVSDGEDTSSRVNQDQVKQEAAAQTARIYSVLLPTGTRGPDRGGKRFLKSLAAATGAQAWEPENVHELEAAVGHLTQELKRLSSIE